uniref:Uncharacterized protein n=1 Tax=Mola mola TaxID=94237 RepID=A0A3Q3XAN5_MOLML
MEIILAEHDLLVSSAVLSAAVLLSEATRRAAARLLPGRYRIYALEAASTFQLCSCTHELKLLGDSARLEVSVGLTLCFIMTVIHVVTFREATCNPSAALERLACSFTVHAAAMHAHKLDEKLRVPFIAAVITAMVYTAGGVSGAVFNPVLAFSTHFPCSGHTYPEYCLVYWLGPVLGMSSCILLFEKIIPFLSGKTTIRPDVPAAHKQKTQ